MVTERQKTGTRNLRDRMTKRIWKAATARIIRAAFVAIPVVHSAHALNITTEYNPPFNYHDGHRVSGISTEILLEMGKRAGVPIQVQLLPWARAYQSALSLPNTCVYSTVRLPEREALFKWIGPLSTNKWALFARSDFDRTISTLDDAREYRIGGVTMDAKAGYLKSLGFTHIDLVDDDNLNRAKLLAGRIDLWISGLYKTNESASPVGRKAIKPVFIVREVEYFLACHPKTSDEPLKALTQALHLLQKEGFVKAVLERYANRLQ